MTAKKKGPKDDVGRPTDYVPKLHCAMARGYARDGRTHEQIAERFGISCSTLYKWKKEHPEFSESLSETPDTANVKVENALWKRAIGYEWVKIETEENGKGDIVKVKKTTMHVNPDPVCMLFWLKGQWKTKHGDTNIDPEKSKAEINALFSDMFKRGKVTQSDGKST